MNALKRSRSRSARRSTSPALSATVSTTPSGSYSSSSCTVVRVAPAGVKYTAPAFVAPSVAAQATFSLGTCSRITARHSRLTPPITATHCSVVSSSWRTSATPSMKCGNSSNCVHCAYAVSTGTSTTVDFATLVAIGPPFVPHVPCPRHAVRSVGLPTARQQRPPPRFIRQPHAVRVRAAPPKPPCLASADEPARQSLVTHPGADDLPERQGVARDAPQASLRRAADRERAHPVPGDC